MCNVYAVSVAYVVRRAAEATLSKALKGSELRQALLSSALLSALPEGADAALVARRLQSVKLFIVGERAQMKYYKCEQLAACEFVPVELGDASYLSGWVLESFRSLVRYYVPRTADERECDDRENEPVGAVAGAKAGARAGAGAGAQAYGAEWAVNDALKLQWLQQVAYVAHLAGVVVDLMDAHCASVLVALEDGWDLTAQVVALAELCLDPFYRTVEGFFVLVDKEFGAFGHPFQRRQAYTSQSFAPVFTQFLAAVHLVTTPIISVHAVSISYIQHCNVLILQ